MNPYMKHLAVVVPWNLEPDVFSTDDLTAVAWLYFRPAERAEIKARQKHISKQALQKSGKKTI